MHEIGIFWDRYRNATVIRRLVSIVTSPFGTIVGFRPGKSPGVFAWLLGSWGCGGIGCAMTLDWQLSGFRGPAFQAGIQQIAVWRSHKLKSSASPHVETAILTQPPYAPVWVSKRFSTSSNIAYSLELREHFDIDLRSKSEDGLHASAAGYMSLGNWQVRNDMQFRGIIHHIELHDKFLSDQQVAEVVANPFVLLNKLVPPIKTVFSFSGETLHTRL